MLSKSQEKLIASLKTKKGRQETGLCLVEGKKILDLAGAYVESLFTPKDTPSFEKLVSTQTPQPIAGIARLPCFTHKDLLSKDILIILDGVQDPGNVGTIFRLALGFDASIALIHAADPGNPKVIRSSVGSIFQVPWMQVEKEEILSLISTSSRTIYRLEKRDKSTSLSSLVVKKPCVIIIGSEGQGIHLPIEGISVSIPHEPVLESLNVSHALAILLYQFSCLPCS